MINAALALAAKPNSKVAQDNMDLFKEQWEKQVRVLTDAVDDITSIDDFLSVSGKCVCVCGLLFLVQLTQRRGSERVDGGVWFALAGAVCV